jgi:DNA-binding transcriptional regulator YhcF (GntR family)
MTIPRATTSPRATGAPGATGAQATSAPRDDLLTDVAIDRAGEVPIGVQLAWALRARIADGRLAPGERLPGLRELAETLGINANTARSVYQRLEQEGLIDSRQGTGTFVAGAGGGRSAAAGQIAADAARRAQSTGVDPREVAAALYVAVPGADAASTQAERVGRAERAGRSNAGSGSGERRRELRAQIAALEQALSELHACHPGAIPLPAEPRRRAGPRLLSVEDLEDVRGELVRRLAETEPLLQAARAQEREAAQARRAQAARTAAANARARTSAEQRSARKQADAERQASAGKAAAKKQPSAHPTRRPGPSTA